MFDEGADKLFDVFDQKAELAQSTSSSVPAKAASNKRKEVRPVSKPVVKKNKIDATPKAILTDSFELQSTREVKVVPTISEKDLPSTANDALVGLSHQVYPHFSHVLDISPPLPPQKKTRFVIMLPCLLATIMSLWECMLLQPCLQELIPSSWIHSKKPRLPVSSVMSRF